MSDKWTWNFDVYDESDSPTEEGYYRIIDIDGNETTDYFFAEPRMCRYGIGYWKESGKPIIAWKKSDAPTIEMVEHTCETCKHDNDDWGSEYCDGCVCGTDKPSNWEGESDGR